MNDIEKKNKKFWVRTVLTVIILSAALYIVLSGNFSSDTEKWAFAATGIVLVYWFKSEGEL